MILILPDVYDTLGFLVPIFLIIASLFLIIKEKKPFLGLTIFLFAGVLGIVTLNLQTIKEPLFPLLTGLFGTSTILVSLKEKTRIPEQKITKEKISSKEIASIIPSSVISSSLCAFLPGFGSSQAAVLSSQFEKNNKPERFLILLGAISTLVLGFNFAALYIISKARSGTGIIIQKFLSDITLNQLWLFIIIILVSGSIAVLLSLFLAKAFAKNISKINYSKMNLAVLIILIIMSIIISGWLSLIVLITATALGILAINSQVKRIQLMGSIILPVIFLLIS